MPRSIYCALTKKIVQAEVMNSAVGFVWLETLALCRNYLGKREIVTIFLIGLVNVGSLLCGVSSQNPTSVRSRADAVLK